MRLSRLGILRKIRAIIIEVLCAIPAIIIFILYVAYAIGQRLIEQGY